MGKVLAPPASIPVPRFMDYFGRADCNIKGYHAAEIEYVKAVSEFAKRNGHGELAGEEIKFSVADGYARYIVFSTKPVVLLHLQTSDGWQYQYANRLTAKDIQGDVARNRAFERIFSR